MNRLLRLFLLIPMIVTNIHSEELPSVRIKHNASSDKLIKEYLKHHKTFFKELCPGGTEDKYWKIVRDYRGNGNFIPTLTNGNFDKQAIRHHFHHFDKKIKWIDKVIKKISNENNFKNKLKDIENLEVIMEDLVIFKKEYYQASDLKAKTRIRINSSEKMEIFRKSFNSLMNKLYFLKSYNFPVDHFSLRQDYDLFKNREDNIGKQKANQIYFYRKLTEDGAYNPDLTGSDLFLRATLSMTSIRLKEASDFLIEEIRYDLNSALKYAAKHLKKGKHIQIQRLNEWKERVKRRKDFYSSLLVDKVKIGTAINTSNEFVKAKSLARIELREHIYQKQIEVYNFWTKLPEIMRYLFVMDTILYNEVGAVDGKDALERIDVVKVVLNRSNIDFYSTLSPKGALSDLFIQYDDLTIYKWLNILFKEGEFSFTYYFIPATIRIFCPDQTRIGQYLRKKNFN